YAYSLSFAVALCEGPIDGIGRVWADGQPMDMAGVTMRLHRGTEDQLPDPLIEAVEGRAPAYTGAAYVVFEGLPLDAYGDRPPQLAFEGFRRPQGAAPQWEDRLEGVCLIPGAGEFCLATEPVMRREGLAKSTPAREMTLHQAALALPDKGGSAAADRRLTPRPGAARLRFIDEAADYQLGAVTVRGDGEGGGVDAALPAVVGAGLATAAAQRLLQGEAAERLTLKLGPLEALKLEPGDVAAVEGRAGDWRVERLDWDETPRAVLTPVVEAVVVDAPEDWRGGGGGATTAGAPFLMLLDLPPLPGEEADGRPVVAAAAEPWTPMALHGGASVDSLTPRAVVETPATVGTLTAPLRPGVVGRWDETAVLSVRIEGQAPQSWAAEAVLSGANLLAVRSGEGWELVQFRRAELVGGDVWRLSGLLRGQQGTEEAAARGAEAGALVVVLERGMARAEVDAVERGLPRIWRAGPAGAPPGGAGTTEVGFTWANRSAAPWRPAHLRA